MVRLYHGEVFMLCVCDQLMRKRIPIALPHRSIKLEGTKYWSKDALSRTSPSYSRTSSFSKLLIESFGTPGTKDADSTSVSLLGFFNSRNCSIGWHDWSDWSQSFCDESFSLDNVSTRSNNGLGDCISRLFQCLFTKDEGFLFALKNKIHIGQ